MEQSPELYEDGRKPKIADISKELGKRWGDLGDAEKGPFQSAYDEENKAYKKACDAYYTRYPDRRPPKPNRKRPAKASSSSESKKKKAASSSNRRRVPLKNGKQLYFAASRERVRAELASAQGEVTKSMVMEHMLKAWETMESGEKKVWFDKEEQLNKAVRERRAIEDELKKANKVVAKATQALKEAEKTRDALKATLDGGDQDDDQGAAEKSDDDASCSESGDEVEE